MKIKPLTFFFLGLFFGLAYIGASFYMHYLVLQEAGYQVSSKVEEFKKLSKSYSEASQQIETLRSEIQSNYDRLRSSARFYQKSARSFQQVITRMVQLGKQHDLTFLDYHALPKEAVEEVTGVVQHSSMLSLGGNFDNIQRFIKSLQTSSVRQDLPIMSINLHTSQEGNTRIQLSFTYLGELEGLLDQFKPYVFSEPQSYLIFDPWSNGI